MANQFFQEMRSCITFVHSKNQKTQDIVTKGMVDVAKVFKEAQEVHAENTQLEMEKLQIQLCSLGK
jgi:Spy/CpxP family protein refolding chaperone